MTHNRNAPLTIVVIGGGAAGFFSAIAAARANGDHKVILLEKSRQPLTKVRISGGGRCNVTHSCFDPAVLVKNYPRGGKALLGPFHRFQPTDTIEWFKSEGVVLKTEEDGRMFPVTDDSSTIVNCLISTAKKSGVDLRLSCGVEGITKNEAGFILNLDDGEKLHCDRLILAAGSSPRAWEWLKILGHTIVPPVPSLFTFNTPTSPLLSLAGISVPQVRAKIQGTALEQLGPLLITHWGFSGPAILKLSAWGARILQEKQYRATLLIDWMPEKKHESLKADLQQIKSSSPARLVANESPGELPRNLWKALVEKAGIPTETRWSGLASQSLQRLIEELKIGHFEIQGKSQYKEEFVTCGGIELSEVNFKKMESKICPHLYFAGEILDIDGVTGGFNFQNAWTTAWIAGQSLLETG
ncbi:MAG: NAD(P)/FAD-dependent oxidoreductase [Parachlamydiaceae bacterium]|nr:NAD(P)/FAD-dependent oxidoreductase [Parachlamydiaceae bacterium]